MSKLAKDLYGSSAGRASGKLARLMRRRFLTVAFLALSCALPADSARRDAAAIRAAQTVSVQQLDAKLPSQPFSSWFRDLVGDETSVDWEVNDCGEQSGSAGDDPESIPMCAQASATIKPGHHVVVSIAVGTFARGVSGVPELFWAEVTRDGATQDTIDLSKLAQLLGTPHQPRR